MRRPLFAVLDHEGALLSEEADGRDEVVLLGERQLLGQLPQLPPTLPSPVPPLGGSRRERPPSCSAHLAVGQVQVLSQALGWIKNIPIIFRAYPSRHLPSANFCSPAAVARMFV